MRIVAVGELTDDHHVADDSTRRRELGGAVHVAAGAALWDAEVAVSAAVGEDLRVQVDKLAAAGVDTRAVAVTELPSVQLQLRYLGGGRRELEVLPTSGDHRRLAERRPDWPTLLGRVDGVHLGPQSAAAQRRELQRPHLRTVPVTADVLVDPSLPVEDYRSGVALEGVDTFLPSRQEVDALWGTGVDATEVRQQLDEAVRTVVVTCGADGSWLASPSGRWHVPSAVREVVDPTGAGDAFCGGYLAGLVATGDEVEAAVRGSVSAALVVESWSGLDALRNADAFDRERRTRRLRDEVSRL